MRTSAASVCRQQRSGRVHHLSTVLRCCPQRQRAAGGGRRLWGAWVAEARLWGDPMIPCMPLKVCPAAGTSVQRIVPEVAGVPCCSRIRERWLAEEGQRGRWGNALLRTGRVPVCSPHAPPRPGSWASWWPGGPGGRPGGRGSGGRDPLSACSPDTQGAQGEQQGEDSRNFAAPRDRGVHAAPHGRRRGSCCGRRAAPP